jgi:hypothetical protein
MEYWTRATPEQAPAFADIAVKTLQGLGTHLDYSPQSLFRIDEVIDTLRLGGHTPSTVGDTVFALGCYAGEILVRHSVGVWKNTDAVVPGMESPIVIELHADGSIWNPVGKAFKRLVNGEEDSVAQFVLVCLQYAIEQKNKLDWEHQTFENGEVYIAAKGRWTAVAFGREKGWYACLRYGDLEHWQEDGKIPFPDPQSAREWCETEIGKVEKES